MKPKISFRGGVRPKLHALWEEHKFIIIVLLLGLSLLLTAIIGYAQTITPASKQTPGLPRAIATAPLRVVNYQGNEASLKLSDFRDELLILDFWATYCAPCRLLLPRYDSLQKAFSGKLQILLVTHEKPGAASLFLKQNRYSLPSVIGDTALARAIPHNGIPFEVWIYQGRVVATTDGEALTKEQVQRILDKGEGALSAIPRKIMAPFDEDKPLLARGNGINLPGNPDPADSGAEKLYMYPLYQSLITPYNPGLNRIAGIHRADSHINVFALNGSPLSLYHLACKEIDPLLDVSNRYLFELPDSLEERLGIGLKGPTGKAWLEKYALCYNLYLPANFKTSDLGPFILADLNRFFARYYGIEAVVENREIPCLVLSRIPGSPSIGERGPSRITEYRTDTTETVVRGLPLSQLMLPLAYTYRRLPTPLVDETGYTGPVDLVLDGNIANRDQLDKALRASGLQLTVAARGIPMVVIRPVTAAINSYPSTLTRKP